jgi:hypothetical protein
MSEENRATYSPEDNKLRLYVGRVPRAEYERLRADGWKALHKQREAGGGDFAATWTPSRRDTALSYADIIEDEDMGPEERAADRAERFGEYRDKRTDEATGQADSYDAGPAVHGYQSQARADRAAARHDRIAGRAVDAWSKAEYWQRRTAGVIAHALYKSSPGVRMGRIKTLEAELRKCRADIAERLKTWQTWQKIAAMTDPDKQTMIAERYAGMGYGSSDYAHPVTGKEASLWDHLRNDNPDRITGAQAAALWLARHSEPAAEDDWTQHLTLRLAYENQMLKAQGGRAAFVEIEKGGRIGGKLIVKVCKSPATGRVVSVFVKAPPVSGWAYRTKQEAGRSWSLFQIETERLPESAYTGPTPENLAELEAMEAERQASKPEKAPCPLINPTDADAERLQALWNERARVEWEARNEYTSPEARKCHSDQFKPSTVCRVPQAVYSANSKGSFAKAETRELCANGELSNRESNLWTRHASERAKRIGPAVCKVRITWGDGSTTNRADRVIVLTDKPQNPLPAAVWQPYVKPTEDATEKYWKESAGQSVLDSYAQSEVRELA